jgi:BirA family biotin operon repressor/biotin-[acetyl-CoA-carboxylase] ligase
MQASKQVPAWNGAAAAVRLRTALPGVEVQWLAEIDSTNTELKRQISAGPASPTLLFTDQQTQGRGRLGRSWIQASPGLDLAMSLATPMPAWADGELRLSLLCGVTVALALEGLGMARVGLKWPNDIELPTATGWKKVGGILLEVTPGTDGRHWLVAGVGLNVNCSAAGFPKELRNDLCTLADIAGERDLQSILSAVASAWHVLLIGNDPEVELLMQEWLKRDTTRGRSYLLHRDGEAVEVMAASVDCQTGALQCVDQQGAVYVVTSYSELERLP